MPTESEKPVEEKVVDTIVPTGDEAEPEKPKHAIEPKEEPKPKEVT